MKILIINKFFFPFGGTERYMFSLIDLLESHGHETIPFAMEHPDNVISEYSKYFVSSVDLSRPKISRATLKAAGRVIYSFEAARKLRRLIRDTKPDLAHLQTSITNFRRPVLKVLKEEGIPVCKRSTTTPYLSPSYGLFDHGAVCERVTAQYYRAILHKCVKNSAMASALDAFAYRVHATLGLDERLVGRLIAPSEFVKNKFAEWGKNVFRMEVLPHFIDADRYEPEYAPGAEIAYVRAPFRRKGNRRSARGHGKDPRGPPQGDRARGRWKSN